ncbi:MAG TPA: ABC transporter substrate-binding protein [Microlunatus sp.]
MTDRPRLTRRTWIIVAVAVVVVLGGAGAGFGVWRSQQEQKPVTQPAVADPVAISVPDAPRKLTVGVLITLSAQPGQGSEWKSAADGARVAARRLAMGGVQVELKTVDDKGTTKGAEQAVKELADEGASGAVVATSGSHVKGAVEAAQQAGLPLVMPYESDPELAGDLAWATGPTDPTVGQALATALTAAKLEHPLVIDAGSGVPDGVKATRTLSFTPGDDTASLIKQARKLADKSTIDTVLVSGPATAQATLVQALQGGNITVPLYLTPDATSPAFTSALVEAQGSLSTSFNSVGANFDDPAALQADAAGRAMSSFLSAVRSTAADEDQKNLTGDQPFSSVAQVADSRSHDAVIALVRAAASAKSADAVKISDAMENLKLGYDDGLAGPGLDFSRPAALDPDAVHLLRSSRQDLGFRPTDENADPRLVWFADPSAK